MNSKYMKGSILPPVIGNNSRVGGGSCILPEITIGNNALIGAGSVVTKKVSNNEKVLGNPAKVV